MSFPQAESSVPRTVLVLTLLADGGGILATADALPAEVATTFGLGGAPSAWMGRHAYTLNMLAFGVALPLAMALLIGWLPRRFPRHVNIPHGDHWLAPARRDATLAYLAAQGCWLGCIMSLTVGGLHALLVQVAMAPQPRLDLAPFMLVIGASVAASAAWAFGLYRRFRRVA